MIDSLRNDTIFETIQGEIVSLKIKPGSILSEHQLSERFSVSRTPIRSILQRLQQLGFVKIVPGIGTIVTPIDMKIVEQMIYMRVAAETMVLRDFIRFSSPTDVERVRYSLSELEKHSAVGDDPMNFDINLFLQKDFEMHKLWFHTMDKDYIWETLTAPHPDYSRFIRLDIVGAKNVPDVLEDHHQMMDLIDRRCTDGIEELIHRHLNGGIRRLGNLLFCDEYKIYFEPLPY